MGSPVDWQVTKKMVKQRGQYLLETGVWSDCSFIVGTEPHHQVFAGHKLFLAMSSPVFEAMFFGGMAEKNDHPIPILDVQPEAFKALLEYIYTDKINLNSFDQACELCYGAKKYMLPHLVEECTNYLWSDLYPKNACRAYEFAKLFEEPTLMDKCLQIICRRTQEVLSESSFEDVELTTLVTIYSQEKLNIESELDLFNALTRYAAKHGNSGVVAKKSRVESNVDGPANAEPVPAHPTIRDVLMKIRFLTLSPQQFADGPALSDLLSQSEKFDIFMNISSQLSSTPMPDGFSASTAPRKKCVNFSNSDNQILPYCDPDNPMIGPSCDHAAVPMVPNEEHIRNVPRYFCLRSLVKQTDCWNPSSLDCAVTFSVDRNICIIGVQVPAQVGHINSHPSSLPTVYSELLYAHLVDGDGSRLTYLHYTARVNFRSMIDLTFNRPVYIQKNKDYKVGVVFNRPGWYPMGTCTPQSTIVGVTFTFGGGSCSDAVRDGLIRSIIFSY